MKSLKRLLSSRVFCEPESFLFWKGLFQEVFSHLWLSTGELLTSMFAGGCSPEL